MSIHEQSRALAYLENLTHGELEEELHGALDPGWLKRIVLGHLRGHLGDPDMRKLIDHLALDEPGQGEINDYEGRWYDRQRA